MNPAYTADFNAWIDPTSQLLRQRRWHEMDWEHLIDEVEDLGKSEHGCWMKIGCLERHEKFLQKDNPPRHSSKQLLL